MFVIDGWFPFQRTGHILVMVVYGHYIDKLLICKTVDEPRDVQNGIESTSQCP